MSVITVKLSESILTQLRGKGLTAQRAGEMLGSSPRQSEHLMAKAGAVQVKGVWRMGSAK